MLLGNHSSALTGRTWHVWNIPGSTKRLFWQISYGTCLWRLVVMDGGLLRGEDGNLGFTGEGFFGDVSDGIVPVHLTLCCFLFFCQLFVFHWFTFSLKCWSFVYGLFNTFEWDIVQTIICVFYPKSKTVQHWVALSPRCIKVLGSVPIWVSLCPFFVEFARSALSACV